MGPEPTTLTNFKLIPVKNTIGSQLTTLPQIKGKHVRDVRCTKTDELSCTVVVEFLLRWLLTHQPEKYGALLSVALSFIDFRSIDDY